MKAMRMLAVWPALGPALGMASHSGAVELPLTNSGNAVFTADVYVGSHRALFHVVLDTGSADIWLPGPRCRCAGRHRRFDPATSSSARALPGRFAAAYGSGSVAGRAVEEELEIGGLALRLRIGVIEDACKLSGYSSAAYDGVIGLGPKARSGRWRTGDRSPLDSLKAAGFGVLLFDLCSQSPTCAMAGTVRDLNGRLGPFSFLPLAGPAEDGWLLSLEEIRLGSRRLPVARAPALMDTGSTLLAAPESEANALAAALGARARTDRLYTIPCEKVPSLPVIHLVLGGGRGSWTLSIPPTSYVLLDGFSGHRHVRSCILALSAKRPGRLRRGASQSKWVLGCSVLGQCQTAFDAQRWRIGFARPAAVEGSP